MWMAKTCFKQDDNACFNLFRHGQLEVVKGPFPKYNLNVDGIKRFWRFCDRVIVGT